MSVQLNTDKHVLDLAGNADEHELDITGNPDRHVLDLPGDSDEFELEITGDSDEHEFEITMLNYDSRHALTLSTPVAAGTNDYNNLINKPTINGVIVDGGKTSADLRIVSENSEDGWDSMRTYVPQRGEICFYSDLRKIKIGDGTVSIVDLPFIAGGDTDEIMNRLNNHISDAERHVTQLEREFWNAKLNCDITGERLIFTRN